MTNKLVLIEQTDDVVTLTLNRPEVHNALNPELMQTFLQYLEVINQDPSLRVLVLRGAQEHFCAGGDINWLQSSINNTTKQNLREAQLLGKVLYTLNTLRKPTICVTQGAVYGGGVGLVACCDIVIAAVNTVFCCSEVKLGIAASMIAPYVCNVIGYKAARRWLLTAETFNSTTAAELGLVQAIGQDSAELDHKLEYFLQHIRQAGPAAVAATKELILAELPWNSIQTANDTAKLLTRLRTTSEAQEGLQAFLAKRAPTWAK